MIIGITGLARSGKDTCADILCEELNKRGYNVKKVALAEPMKEACRIIFGWNNDYLYGDKKDLIDDNYGISPRHVLQTMGTEWGQFMLSKFDNFRKVTGRKLWIKSLLNKYVGQNIIISDVRFVHEAEEIRNNNGFIIKIERSGIKQMKHKSEKEIKKIQSDVTINNDGDLFDYKDEVLNVMNIILSLN
jgi:hypothetical protein